MEDLRECGCKEKWVYSVMCLRNGLLLIPGLLMAGDRTHSAIFTPEVIPSTTGLSDWEALLSLRLWSLGRGLPIDLGLVLQL